jgi:hypothetical protein
MLRKTVIILAIALVLGNFGPSAGALARAGDHGGGADSFRGSHLRGGVGGIAGDSFGSNGYPTGGLPGGLRASGNHDVWGRRGTYYGPLVPTI